MILYTWQVIDPIFETKIYGTKIDEPTLDSITQTLKNNENWENLHAVSPEKAKLLDSYNSSTPADIAIIMRLPRQSIIGRKM